MIRRAEDKDLARVDELLSQVLEVHAKGRPDIFKAGTRKYRDEELLALFKDDSRPVYVYTDKDDVVLGYAFCAYEYVVSSNNLQDMKTLYIDDICVDERFRGRHIATALYHHLQKIAKENGCYHITLNVWALNPVAQKFYEKMGMKPLKTMMEEIILK